MTGQHFTVVSEKDRLGLLERMDRIERKLDLLIDVLADEPEGPTHDLDGNELPQAREGIDSL